MEARSSATWLLLTFAVLFLGAVAAWAVGDLVGGMAPIGESIEAGFAAQQRRLTVFHGLWPVAAMALASAVVRRGSGLAWGWAAAGAITAALLEYTLLVWSDQRFGDQAGDPDHIGSTVFLAFWVATASIVAGVRELAPASARVALRVVSTGVALIAIAIVGSNVPGLGNGIRPDSISLAAMVGIGGAVALLAAAMPTTSRAGRAADVPTAPE